MMNDGLSQHFFIQKADGRLPVQSDSFSDSIGVPSIPGSFPSFLPDRGNTA